MLKVMANLGQLVNKFATGVIKNINFQAQIEKMQLTIVNGGIDMASKQIGRVIKAWTAAKQRENSANAAKIDLKGDYRMVAAEVKKSGFFGKTYEEIEEQIYNGYKQLRAVANDEQIEIIKQHAKLEAISVAGQLFTIQRFLVDKKVLKEDDVKLQEQVATQGEKVFKTVLSTPQGRQGKLIENPMEIEVKSREEHERERNERERIAERERNRVAV
jgi:hypothetical protein